MNNCYKCHNRLLPVGCHCEATEIERARIIHYLNTQKIQGESVEANAWDNAINTIIEEIQEGKHLPTF